MEELNNSSWLVVRTKSNREVFAQINLINKGIETYYPKYEDKVIRWGKVRRGIKSLFPGYLFSHTDSEELAYSIKWTPGVHSILMQGEKYALIEDSIIQEIKQRSGKKGYIRCSRLKQGTLVIIKNGPFKDCTGIFQCYLNDNDRVKILMNLVQFQSHLIIEKAFLEVI